MCRKQQQQQNHSDSNWIKMLNQFLKPLFNLSETLSCPCSKLSLDLYICWGSYYRSIPTRDEYFTIEEHQQWGQEIFKPIKVDGSSLKSICIRQSQLLLWLLCCTVHRQNQVSQVRSMKMCYSIQCQVMKIYGGFLFGLSCLVYANMEAFLHIIIQGN